MLAARLQEAIQQAGVAITALSIGVEGASSTVQVTPENLQTAAQATIDAFDWAPSAQDAWDLQQATRTLGQVLVVRKTADQSTSLSDVTGLAFTLAPHTHYHFRFVGGYSAAATTTGLAVALNGPASPDFFTYIVQAFTAANAVVAAASGVYETLAPAPASGGATVLPFQVEGTISTGDAGGAFTLRFASEVNASAVTIKRGSLGMLSAAA